MDTSRCSSCLVNDTSKKITLDDYVHDSVIIQFHNHWPLADLKSPDGLSNYKIDDNVLNYYYE